MNKAINLIPRALLTGRLWRARLEIAGITLLVTSLAMGGAWLLLQQRATAAEEEANRSKNNATSVKQVLTPAEVTDTLARVAILNTLAGGEINWPAALADVSKILPKDVRLSTYSYAVGPTGVTLQMGGQSKTAAGFAAFVNSVQADSRFKSVSVDSYTYTPSTGVIAFTMTILQPIAQLIYQPSQ